jgi:glyoxylase-like metal-dependent hydrolase (beta-lactamase superfamily II)
MSLPDYAATLGRLRDLPVRAVHGGHGPSFGRERLAAICEAYLGRWRALLPP